MVQNKGGVFLQVISGTDVGKKRKTNQDSYATGKLRGDAFFAVVCDGMGGISGGNVASRIAVGTIEEQLQRSYRPERSDTSIKNLLVSAITAANINVYEAAKKDSDLMGMGTTVVLTLIRGGNVFIAHAGDSRAYLISKNQMVQLTRDHSVVQDMVETGKITQAEAKAHPRKNIITRALGAEKNINVDFLEENILSQDMLLLCTDGLTNFVSTSQILDIVQTVPFKQTTQKLIDCANHNGGGDNITVVAVKK